MNLERLKYPIGHFECPETITSEQLNLWINDIATFPNRISKAVEHLDNDALNLNYRPEGWTIRQVVHHCADSHMNSLIRFKLALTEDSPAIKPYFEDRWAEMADEKAFPIEASLKIIDGVHERWVYLLRHLSSEDLKRNFVHPEHGKSFRLDENIGVYAWHCNHHLAHINLAKQQLSSDS